MNSNKSVLITGGAKRIGAGFARHFAHKGYNVALHYNHSREEAEALCREIKEMGVFCSLYQGDLSSCSDTLIDRVLKEHPELVLLINNASLFEHDTLRECETALYEKLWNINFHAPLFLTKNFANKVKRGGVINLVDCKVSTWDPLHFTYLLTKKSLLDFTKMAAIELAPGIRVNAIAPGHIMKANSESITSPDPNSVKNILTKDKPDVAGVLKAADYLTENSTVTGQCLFVDGGQNLF